MDTFPLHKLPDRAFSWVLRKLEIYDQLAYSLCSRNAKSAIKSLNLKAFEIEFTVTHKIEMRISFENYIFIFFYIDHDANFPDNQLISCGDVRVSVELPDGIPIRWEWSFQNSEIKEWLRHFCDVLHHPKIDDLMFNDADIDDAYIIPVQKAIEGLQIGCLSVCEELTPEFTKKALESFSSYEKLFVDLILFENHDLFKMDKYLIQNLKSVCIDDAEKIVINQVLFTNSERIQLNLTMFTEKDFNKFLKLWIRGSNPRLKYFQTRGEPEDGNDSFDENVILKGIKYQRVLLDSEESYKEHVFGNFYNETKLAGGSRIWRTDGTAAVMVVTGNMFQLIAE